MPDYFLTFTTSGAMLLKSVYISVLVLHLQSQKLHALPQPLLQFWLAGISFFVQAAQV